MIIDAHMHLWNKIDGRLGNVKVNPLKDGAILIGRQKVQGMPTWFSDCRNTAEMAIAAFDDAGVDAAVVTQEYLDGNQNEYLIKVKKKHQDRFFVHGLIDFTKPAGLDREFKQVVKAGFKGIKCPAMFLPKLKKSVQLNQPELMEIWQKMQDSGMILSIDLAEGDAQVPQMKDMIKTFPGLKIAIGHFGLVGKGNWLSQIRLAKFDNVYIETGGIIWLFRADGTPFEKAQQCIKQASDLIGVEKMMWGSDYPRTMVDFTYCQSMEFITKGCRFFNDNQKEAFLGGNAAKLYGFKVGKCRKPAVRITEL